MPLAGKKTRQQGTLRHQMSRPKPEIVSLHSTGETRELLHAQTEDMECVID
jgi:hypothetical protein